MHDLLLPSPLQSLEIISGKVQLDLKREDLIHKDFGGNKWRKLKYNLEEYKSGAYSHLVTFGGAFSNHIAATAAAGNHYSFPTVGIIRGTYVDVNNVTLGEARHNGMELHLVSREAYRQKSEAAEVKNILDQYPRPLVIPEGGSNALGLKGCQEILTEINVQYGHYDYVVVPAGTGMTASGIISASHKEKILVVNVLKNSGLAATIDEQVGDKENWEVLSDYHFGGYAKVSQELIDFINGYNRDRQILLDPIYNGKGLWAVEDLIARDYFPVGSRILYVLTGGLQGVEAYNSSCKVEGMRIG